MNSKKSFLIVDAELRTGDSWRQRWDTLKLFTPRPFAALPGLSVSNLAHYYPSKDEIADYFEFYAVKFNLPIKHDCRILKLEKKNNIFIAHTKDGTIKAPHVIVANGPFHKPLIPSYATKLKSNIWQLHSSKYQRLSQIPKGDVLIVGGGNSGAQLAVELAKKHKVIIATSGHPWFLPVSIAGISLYWYTYLFGILSADKDSIVSRYVRRRGDGIVGTDLRELIKQGTIKLIASRLIDCKDNKAIFDNGEQHVVTNIIWATGFEPNYDWICVNGAVSNKGLPIHDDGISPINGLYWLGLPWQRALNSSIINGIKKDGKFITNHLLKSNIVGDNE